MNDYKKDFEKSIDFIEWQNDMLKKQADRIADLETALAFTKRKPLSDEEIHELANKHLRTQNQDSRLIVLGLEDFAKAIEERHGIK